MESKKEIYDLIPQKYYPKTQLIRSGTKIAEVLTIIKAFEMNYPLFAKPDIGLRGAAVKKINNGNELKSYCEYANFDYLIQELIPYPNEIGIFYVRYPNQAKGKITGIVAKEFLVVTGDGIASIEELIKRNPRYELQLNQLRREYGIKLKDTPPKGAEINLVPYGNHSRGAKFIDATSWITPKMTTIMNEICLQIPGFYFGRLDIMYDTIAAFEKGERFSIVELNGAGSEPTHIYDPRHSIFFAWTELARHIRYMYEISVANHKKGAPYLSHKDGMEQYRLHNQMNKVISKF